MSNNLAPIILFVYNRPEHTQKTLEALKQNDLAKESELFVFCDGVKNKQDLIKIEEVYKIIDKIEGFKKITIKRSSINNGLANSIISGVTQVLKEYNKAIILEDDMITSCHFLKYMNDGLNFYENNDKVISIHGYNYPVKEKLPETFFLKGADCWGWATWRRGWKIFEKNGTILLNQLKQRNLTKKFDLDGSYPYTRMLEDQINGKNNSWAIRWHASAFLADKLTLYPAKSLILNIGIDGSGTNCADMRQFDTQISDVKVKVAKISVEENQDAVKAIKKFLKPKKNFLIKLFNKINKKIKKKQNKKQYKQYGWFTTNYNWQELKSKIGGYDNEKILEKCKNSLLKVKNEEAVFERDSVIFDKIEYSWPVLSGLLLAATKNNSKLDIIDFGGSLGSVYFQNKKFLSMLKKVDWNIVEQSNFVEMGKKYFESDELKFYCDINSVRKENNPNLLLLSSSIQYLEKPYEFLDEILQHEFPFIIFDLTGFHKHDIDILTIQNVWPEIYQASYPCWFFSKAKFFAKLKEKYEIIEEFDSYVGKEISIDGKVQAGYKGAILKLKTYV